MLNDMNDKLENKCAYSSLKKGMFVVVKKDYLFIRNNENTQNTYNDLNNENIYRGQLGFCYGPTTENPEKYIVLFRDKDADPISFADGMNELEVKKDDVIPLLLPHVNHPEIDKLEKCYDDDRYKRKDKKTPLNTFIVELPQPESKIPVSKNNDQYLEYEQERDNANRQTVYEMVSCPNTNMFIHHNETENQFKPDSLVTVQDVCCGAIDTTFFLYPGQVGKIIEPYPLMDSTMPFSSDDYVKVIF